MLKNSILFFVFLLSCAPAFATGDVRPLPGSSYDDIFISTENADVTAVPAQGAGAIYWRDKYCILELTTPAERVLYINIRPRRQHVFVKWLLGIQVDPCKIRLEAASEKNIYISSEVGSIKVSDLPAKHIKLYTASGNIDIDNHSGPISAETLTGRITARNIKSHTTDFKSASGHITAAGEISEVSILNTSGNSKLHGVMDVLRFYSSEGNLHATWPTLPQNPLEISARSFAGDIEIMLPRHANPADNKNNINLKSFYGKTAITQHNN